MTAPQLRPSSELRRRLVPPLVAVTVLAVLLGGGYALRGSTGAASGSGTPTVLRLADYHPPTAGNPADNFLRLTIELPDGPAEAAVRWLAPPQGAEVERLAKALGLRGHLTTTGGVSTYTTDTASLRVQLGAGGQWQYARAAFLDGTFACPRHPTSASPSADDPSLTVGCDVGVPVPLGGDPTSTGPAPRSGRAIKTLAITSPEAARAAARPVLEAVGIDPRNAEVRTGQGVVAADPTVERLPTDGLTTTVRVTGTRVSSAAGYLGGSQAGSTYPVISARAARRQLVRTPMVRRLIACPEPQPAGNDPMICGGPITVTGARFGLSLHEENGRPLLVPSWLFDVRGSDNPLSVVAVDPRYLAAPPIATAGGSTPGSTGSGSGSGGSGSGGSTGTVVPPVAPSSDPEPSDPEPSDPEPSDPALAPVSRFSSVTPSGTGLNVTFTGGVRACFSYTVVPTETNRQVSLSLVEATSSTKRCIEMAQVYERHVALAAPLGTRQVVDGRTGAMLLGAPR
jgi:hypothetical protein